MDESRFDRLTRTLGQHGNRRALLRGIAGLGSIAALRGSDAEAARRATPTPTPVSCPGQQRWNGTACVCPVGSTACGSDCCVMGMSVCCDGACCAGVCIGEEQCCTPLTCPTGIPDSLLDCGSGSDGCGGSIDCVCPANWLCIAEAPRNFCANLTTTCIPGVTASAYGKIGICDSASGFCANTVTGTGTVCVSLTEAICNDCTSDADCSAISGAVCVEAYVGVCPSSATTMCAQVL